MAGRSGVEPMQRHGGHNKPGSACIRRNVQVTATDGRAHTVLAGHRSSRLSRIVHRKRSDVGEAGDDNSRANRHGTSQMRRCCLQHQCRNQDNHQKLRNHSEHEAHHTVSAASFKSTLIHNRVRHGGKCTDVAKSRPCPCNDELPHNLKMRFYYDNSTSWLDTELLDTAPAQTYYPARFQVFRGPETG